MKTFRTFAEEWKKPEVKQIKLDKDEESLMDKLRTNHQNAIPVKSKRELKAAKKLIKQHLVTPDYKEIDLPD
jgi:hypothetical protein